MISENPLYKTNIKFNLYLQKYPSGKYGWCGSVPENLCILRKNHICQQYLDTKIYDTLEDALKDANNNNITNFKII